MCVCVSVFVAVLVVVVYLRCLSSLDALLSICTRKVRHLASFMRTFAHINLRFRHYESTLHFLFNNLRVRHTRRMRNAAQVPQQMALSEMSNELSLIVAPAAEASAAASPLSNLPLAHFPSLSLSSPLPLSVPCQSLCLSFVMRVFVFD